MAEAAKSMILKHLTISGFRGISNSPGQELRLPGLSTRNVFIGQNNGGKSTAYRFLLLATHHLARMGTTFPFQQSLGSVDLNLFWRQDEQVEPWAVLTFSSPGPDFAKVEQPGAGGAIVRDNEWRLGVRVQRTEGQTRIFAAPQVRIDAKNEWMDVVRTSGPQGGEVEYLGGSGEYTRQPAREKSPFFGGANSLAPLVKAWAGSARFFEPFRSFRGSGQDRGGQTDPRVEDGSGVLHRLFEWQNNHTRSGSFQRFRNRLRDRLNRLFDRPYAEILLRGAPAVDMSLTLDAPDAIPIPLQSMGSGIAQMVIILASLEADSQNPGAAFHYHLEEPELHLHPRLLRRFVAQLGDYPNVQFFLSSHSNVILDALEEGDRVYWFSQGPAGNCLARPVEGVVEQHHLLDALGVSGGTLLQTNCVIWVEGPSDRLYLRRWLTELASEKGEELLEGADYAFVFYGGKVLSHFGLDAEDWEPEDLVPMLAISRYSAVVMDRDRSPAQPERPLSGAKQKILDAAARDRDHRLACVSEGREIENDLPLAAFGVGVAKRLGIDVLDSLDLTGEDRYPDEVLARLQLPEPEAKTARRKLEDKVALATAVLDCLDEGGQKLTPRPAYIDALFEFVRRSRGE